MSDYSYSLALGCRWLLPDRSSASVTGEWQGSTGDSAAAGAQAALLDSVTLVSPTLTGCNAVSLDAAVVSVSDNVDAEMV